MYKPTGFVSARMIAKKRRIWRMPTLVIRFSEKTLHHGGKEDRRETVSPCPLFLRGGELNHAPFLPLQNFSGWNIAQLRYTRSRIETMPDRM